MKSKRLLSIFICILMLSSLSACGEKVYPAMSDFVVENETLTTSGLQAGDNISKFIELYGQYDLSFRPADSKEEEYISIDLKSEEFQSSLEQINGDFLLATFYLDEQPQSALDLSKTFFIDDSVELFNYLRSSEFLKEHSLLYRFMLVHVENGNIVSIESDSLDYNAEYQTS